MRSYRNDADGPARIEAQDSFTRGGAPADFAHQRASEKGHVEPNIDLAQVMAKNGEMHGELVIPVTSNRAVSEVADRFRVTADAVYLWIKQGKIPSDCVARIAGTVRVDEDQFEQRLRSGALCQPRGRKRLFASEDASKPLVSGIAKDSLTTFGTGPGSDHRLTDEAVGLQLEHLFIPEMVAAQK